MTKIAVVHPDLMTKGGGEAVCMNTLEALQSDYDVTLVTITEPSFSKLNKYYNTDVKDIKIRKAGFVGPLMNTIGERLYDIAGVKLNMLQNTLLVRYINQKCSNFDLLVSTFGGYDFEKPAVIYTHYPTVYRGRGVNFVKDIYTKAIYNYASLERDSLAKHEFLTNSQWTANRVREAYGTIPRVIYPPVETTDFKNRKWEERERGFVTVGRIDPSKNVLRSIEIVKSLRQQGHEVHLHIVGPTTHPDYLKQIQEEIQGCDFIEYEGELDREDLVDLISRHRYGLHGRENEHFGIVVAEFVAGGMIPFVPDSGGQVEIVSNDELTYSDSATATQKIGQILSDEKTQERIRADLENTCQQFSQETFKRRILAVIEKKISDTLG